MDAETIDKWRDKVEVQEEPNESRAEAGAYLSCRSLVSSGRAVKKQGHDLILQFAGDSSDLKRYSHGNRKIRLKFPTGKEAKRAQELLLRQLLMAKTDHRYNLVLGEYIQRVYEQQLSNMIHVHDCEVVRKDPNAKCGFDWSQHVMSPHCTCEPTTGREVTPKGEQFCTHHGACSIIGVVASPNDAPPDPPNLPVDPIPAPTPDDDEALD